MTWRNGGLPLSRVVKRVFRLIGFVANQNLGWELLWRISMYVIKPKAGGNSRRNNRYFRDERFFLGGGSNYIFS